MKATVTCGAEQKEVEVLWTILPPPGSSRPGVTAFVVAWPLYGRMLFWLDSGLPVARLGRWMITLDSLEQIQQYFKNGQKGRHPQLQRKI